MKISNKRDCLLRHLNLSKNISKLMLIIMLIHKNSFHVVLQHLLHQIITIFIHYPPQLNFYFRKLDLLSNLALFLESILHLKLKNPFDFNSMFDILNI